jgi:hypothetical protein
MSANQWSRSRATASEIIQSMEILESDCLHNNPLWSGAPLVDPLEVARQFDGQKSLMPSDKLLSFEPNI